MAMTSEYVRKRAPLRTAASTFRIVSRQVNEQASRVVNAWRSDLLQDHVFADAFLRRFGILYDVAAAAVQESVAAAGSSVGQVFLLQQDCGNTAQRKVPQETGTGGTSADDYDLCLFHTSRLRF